jgi:hypothetical protein
MSAPKRASKLGRCVSCGGFLRGVLQASQPLLEDRALERRLLGHELAERVDGGASERLVPVLEKLELYGLLRRKVEPRATKVVRRAGDGATTVAVEQAIEEPRVFPNASVVVLAGGGDDPGGATRCGRLRGLGCARARTDGARRVRERHGRRG